MQIGSLIRRAARHYGDAACVTEGGQTLSFREFDTATDRLGNALLATGLKPGDRVGVLLPNGTDCLLAYYALAKAGLVRLGLNTRETLENHEYKLAETDAHAVIHNGGERFGLDVEIDRSRLEDMLENGDDAACRVDRELDAPYRIGFTGGTTGRPKGVVLTTRGELSEISAFLTDLIPDIGPDDSFLHAAPIAHASGAFFLPAIERGAHSVIMPAFDAEEFLELAEKSRASLTFLVPTMLAMIMDAPGVRDAELNLRRIAYGASPISSGLLGRAEARFGQIFAQTYGQAESPMVITCLKPEDHGRAGSCGRPFTIAEVAVVDPEDNFLPPNEPGEIVTRGPQTMAGYWNRPEATAEAFRNGWLHTGDVGTMDDDGFFYILDRKDDMLISGGFNVYPREVEDILMACEGVREAAVVGLPDEIWGDRVHAVVTGRSGLCSQQVMAHAKGHLANYKRPKDIEVWPELPKSAANKILRRSVRERILKGEPS
ncbi:MAG: AMP-binding protein [Gammaproteobacteria bacterium]|nr:AMP-binding protein [Gammaproteobacteria bacterium]